MFQESLFDTDWRLAAMDTKMSSKYFWIIQAVNPLIIQLKTIMDRLQMRWLPSMDALMLSNYLENILKIKIVNI